MKKTSSVIIVISILMTITSLKLSAQPGMYEAANWKIWLMDNPGEIKLSPPPVTSKEELKVIHDRMKKADAKTLASIAYWNAGAPAYRWNQISTAITPWDNPDVMLRTPSAWMNLAIYDATVLAWKEKVKYKRQRPQSADASIKPLVISNATYSYPCEYTVTAAAASYVLAYFLPAKADSLLALARAASQSRVDAGLQYPSDVEAGWKLGEEVAKRIIEKAKNDGSANKYTGPVNRDKTRWTGPYAMGINLPLLLPMGLISADQFRPAPPPDFTKEMNDMKNFKQTGRSKSLAYYWANAGPDLYNEVASRKMFEYGIMNDAPAAARIYALLHISFHDMAIAVFDAKYAYWGIRPAQMDTTYKPILMTPPFPGYPSGHAAGAGSTAAVLSWFFPADAKEFNQMAQDCADSRFYAGIHFKTDNEVALKMGKDLANFIVERWMK